MRWSKGSETDTYVAHGGDLLLLAYPKGEGWTWSVTSYHEFVATPDCVLCKTVKGAKAAAEVFAERFERGSVGALRERLERIALAGDRLAMLKEANRHLVALGFEPVRATAERGAES